MSKKMSVADAEAALEKAKAELRDARARETEEDRKRDAHRKILAGSYLIKLFPDHPKVLQAFYDYLAPKDRKAFEAEFANLKPVPSKEPPAQGGSAGTEGAGKTAAPKTAPAAPVAVKGATS